MFALLSVAACNNLSDIDELQSHTKVLPTFEASIVGTRAYIDENLHLRWNAKDEISLFYGDTYNLNSTKEIMQ